MLEATKFQNCPTGQHICRGSVDFRLEGAGKCSSEFRARQKGSYAKKTAGLLGGQEASLSHVWRVGREGVGLCQ